MHSKRKGNIGQLAIATKLAELQYSIFTEQGDISKIDLIAEKDGKIIRIQCKAITPINGVLRLAFNKSGPNYQFNYTSEMFDYFGLYDMASHKVYLLPVSFIDKQKTIALRIYPAKNNQSMETHSADEFGIEKILDIEIKPIREIIRPYIHKPRATNRPTKEELEKLLSEIPSTKICKKYGVADKTVKNWARYYDLSKKPRGYWTKLRTNTPDSGEAQTPSSKGCTHTPLVLADPIG